MKYIINEEKEIIKKIISLNPTELTEHDMCYDFMSDPNDLSKHCLLGWCSELGGKKNDDIYFYLKRKIKEHIWKNYSRKTDDGKPAKKIKEIGVPTFNDTHSKKTNAKVFNSVIKSLRLKAKRLKIK